jgi:hypothetical protein
VFDDAFTHFEGKIEPRKARVASLQSIDEAQRLDVVVEALPETPHFAIEGFFSGVSERRMADVMNERESFGEIFVESQNASYSAGHLGNFDRVSEAIAKVVGKTRGEDLRLVFETTEGAGVDDAVAIALKRVAVFVFRFGIATAAGLVARKAQMAEHSLSGPPVLLKTVIFAKYR